MFLFHEGISQKKCRKSTGLCVPLCIADGHNYIKKIWGNGDCTKTFYFNKTDHKTGQKQPKETSRRKIVTGGNSG